MDFVSLDFFVPLAIFLGTLSLLPWELRPFLILLFGVTLFLVSAPLGASLFLGSCLLDYGAARWMLQNRRAKGLLLWMALGANVLLLVFFKMLPGKLLSFHSGGFGAAVAVPLGISYLVFKRISYLLDVRRGSCSLEHSLTDYLQYVFFFGDIFAGPINRAGEMMTQFQRRISKTDADRSAGVQLFVWGLFKKIVVADRMAALVDPVFSRPGDSFGVQVLLGILLFSVQIYADFSGYTDMALGIARLAGFRMRANFHLPYGAVSIKEFWNRWHISLSLWLRDYLFLPLAMKTSRFVRKDMLAGIPNENWAYGVAALVTMCVCGLWHGSNWTFLVWGAAHGIWLITSHLSRRLRKKARKRWIGRRSALVHALFRRIFTFSLVSFLWLFFRSDSLGDALMFVSALFTFRGSPALSANQSGQLPDLLLGQTPDFWLITLLAALFMFVLEYINRNVSGKDQAFLPFFSRVSAWPVWIVIVLAVLNLGLDTPFRFIYTQF